MAQNPLLFYFKRINQRIIEINLKALTSVVLEIFYNKVIPEGCANRLSGSVCSIFKLENPLD